MNKEKIMVSDILEAPPICGPFAVKQHGDDQLNLICPWCGATVGSFPTKNKTYADLVRYASKQMLNHVDSIEDCRLMKSTVTLVMQHIQPTLKKHWESRNIDLEEFNGTS